MFLIPNPIPEEATLTVNGSLPSHNPGTAPVQEVGELHHELEKHITKREHLSD